MSLHTFSITTDASGDYSAAGAEVVGYIEQYRYVPDGTSPLDTGADLTIAGTKTGMSVAAQSNIGTSAFTKAPRQPTHDTAGVASLFAGAGEPVEDKIYLDGESLTVTVAQGGDTLSGTLYIWVKEF